MPAYSQRNRDAPITAFAEKPQRGNDGARERGEQQYDADVRENDVQSIKAHLGPIIAVDRRRVLRPDGKPVVRAEIHAFDLAFERLPQYDVALHVEFGTASVLIADDDLIRTDSHRPIRGIEIFQIKTFFKLPVERAYAARIV